MVSRGKHWTLHMFVGHRPITTNSRAQLVLTSVLSSYLHFDDSLESLRLGWLRLKLASSVQFLGRNTIEISLTVHPSVIP